ncbi:MAG TPA: carboxypeptidase-like regulatory domain-containing protein, partial [Spirochaetia bacterium]|nr:carboxypeptidase-like regulatory domain-containing protein [Spirochaetia bacterium]
MNKRVLQMGGLAALLVGLTLSMTGCGLIANALSSVNGTIVDARAYGAALSGALVTLQSVSDSSYVKSDTTDSSGEFSFSGLDSSKQPFEITASYSGYFIPPTRVNQNGFSLNIGDIPALRLSSSDVSGLSFITVWNSTAATVDSYMSFPSADNNSAPGGSSSYSTQFTSPYADPTFSSDTNVGSPATT